MAAPLAGLALRSVGGALMKQGGKAAASKLLGRKKKMQPGKAQPGGQEVGGEKSGAIVVKPQTPMVSVPPPMAEPADVSASTTSSDSDYLKVIDAKVIEIKNLLKGTLAAEKKEQDDREKAEKRANRKKQETKLETKDKSKSKTGKVKLPSAPRTGILDWITNFITKVVLAFFAVRMVEFLPQLLGIVKLIVPVGEFLVDVGIGLIDGFATFIDAGYKVYDWTRGALENIGGDGLVAAFDGVMKAVDIAFTALTIGLLANQMSGGGLFGKKNPKAPTQKPKPGTKLRPKVTTTGGRGINRPDIRNPLRDRPRVTTSGGGTTGRPDIRNPLRQKPKITGSGGGSKLPFKMPSAKALKVGGGIFSAVMAGFEFAGRKASGQTTGQAAVGTAAGVGGGLAGAAKGAAVGAMFGPVGALIGGVIGGVAGSTLGSAVADQVTGVNKMNEGGEVKPATRGFSSTTLQQQEKDLRKKPTYDPIEVPKGGEISVGEKSEQAWWDFLGWAGTAGQEKTIQLGTGGQILAKRVADVGNAFGEDKYFGPILSIASKFILGQKPDDQEYKNVGYGVNMLIGDGVDKNAIRSGYSEGGVVQAAMSGVDISNWVTKTFKKEISDAINKNYDMSSTAVTTKKTETEPGSTAGPDSAPGVRDSATGELMGGTATGAIEPSELYKQIGANEEQWNIYRNSVALIESNGDYSIPGGSGMYYDGRYQMGGPAKTDGAKYAGLPDPGHSDDPDAQVRAAFRADKELQEALFTGFTLANHTYLMRNETYKNSDIERKLQILGYAHNQGMGNAEDWIVTGVVGRDGFGTKGTKYTDLIAANFKAQKSGGDLNLASGAIEVPSITPSAEQKEPAKTSSGPKVSGSSIVGIGKNLISKGFSVAEHPDFTKTPTASGGSYTPGEGTVSNVHQGDGHYQGRAIDVTDWRGSIEDSRARYRSVLDSLQDNPAIKMLIHDSWGAMYGPGQKQGPGSHGHPEHMHIEVKDKGGFIGKGLFANLGGTEFVMDADSSEALKKVAPGLQLALNQAKDAKGVEEALQQYASYDMRGEQTVVVPQPAPQQPPTPEYGSSSMMNIMVSNRSENFSEFLDFQG